MTDGDAAGIREVEDCLLEIDGTVQGVGFRPFVARLAAARGVRGWVCNDGRGVLVRAAAPPDVLRAFVADLTRLAPPVARVAAVRVRAVPAAVPAPPPLPGAGFVIRASDADDAAPVASVPPDLAMCPDCRRELRTPGDRREAYPFINCTQCGPRYSILEALPYDRPRTTMAGFTLCPECRREYDDPGDRRFHAEPNACPRCGPQLEFQDAAGDGRFGRTEALAAAAAALRAGRIVAVKGLGGFHLLVDAGNEVAVRELRRRKRREEKPLAVMFPSLAALRAEAEVSAAEEAWLASPAAPIVLVRRRRESQLAAAIAPGNPWIGALLPYTPLHELLLAAVGRPLVATSANLAEEPLCVDNAEARRRLAGIADAFLLHDRPIARAVDDSVMRSSGGGVVLLRRARGFAPTPLLLPRDAGGGEPLLAVGGHQKNTVAVTAGSNLVLSPHIGDLDSPLAREAQRRTVDLLVSLHGRAPARVACDAHPDYASTRLAAGLGVPVVPVQHHLAHVLACLLEHGGGPGRVLGVAWDGTGYGTDGTVWGGEFIVVDRAERTARRVGHLRPFRLPGGEAAVRDPRRSLLGMAHSLWAGERVRLESLARGLGFAAPEVAVLLTLLDRDSSTPRAPLTTSAGRCFDAVAACLGRRQPSAFEGQAAMGVEFAADAGPADAPAWPLPLTSSSRGAAWELDWRPALAGMLDAVAGGTPDRAELAARFHATLAAGIVDAAKDVGVGVVVLTGGCFQNVRLLELAVAGLQGAGFTALRHRELPPNDGGLAAGQALGVRWGVTVVT